MHRKKTMGKKKDKTHWLRVYIFFTPVTVLVNLTDFLKV